MSTQFTLENVILSFHDLWVPKKSKTRSGKETGDPKYRAVLLLPDDYPDWDDMMDSMNEAAQKSFQEDIQDDYVLPYFQPEKEKYRQFDGQYAVRASNSEDNQPAVVDQGLNPISDKSSIFSGCIVNVHVNFWAYEVDDIGVKAFLESIQLADSTSDKVKRMDGRLGAKDVFKKIKGAPSPTSRPGMGRRSGRSEEPERAERSSRSRPSSRRKMSYED